MLWLTPLYTVLPLLAVTVARALLIVPFAPARITA